MTDAWPLALIALPALGALALALTTLRGWRHLHRLPPVPEGAAEPRVSVISPACNEEEAIEDAVRSMLATGSEVVVVNDRSTDGTADLLTRMEGTGLRVVTIDELPDGWLGKVHAMHRGTEAATGDWLLFADADAVIGEDTLRRAVAWMDAEGVDFLSLMPRITSAGFWGDCVFALSQTMLSAGTKPWALRGDDAQAYGATGAFMLVRRSTFEQTEGFPWLRMEVSDDFGLSLLVKRHGGAIALLDGSDAVALEWYRSFGEMNRKMQKNLFAIMGRCQPWRCYGLALGITSLGLLPLGILLGGPAGWLSGIATGLWLIASVACALRFGRPLLPALFVPLGALLMAFMTVRAGIIGQRIGGVTWRGTVYPSDAINAGRRVLL